MASSLDLFRNGAIGFIDWLDLFDVKLEISEWSVIEPKLNCVLAFRVAALCRELFACSPVLKSAERRI